MTERVRKGLTQLLRSLGAGATLWPDAAAFGPVFAEPGRLFKVLLVVAHPDDESECAAFVYRVTHELGGTVDQVVVTNGEAGARYSAPAEAYYGLPFNEKEAGRKSLARIRRRELLRASRILGIRHNYFFKQKDTGFTFDVREGLQAWDVEAIRQELAGLLQREKYDLVLTLLPSPGTHGHHQTVAQLTLEAVAHLKPEERPAALGVQTATAESTPDDFSELEGYPLTRTTTREPAWTFDRRAPLHGHHALDYSIVVHWVMAEHKSQGIFQMEYGRRTHECFWLFEIGGLAGTARWRNFLQAVRQHPNLQVEGKHPQGSCSTREAIRTY